MPDIEIELPEDLFAFILPVVSGIALELDERLAIDPQMPEDELVQEVWNDELRQRLREDCDELCQQLKENLSQAGLLKVTPDQAEALLRACSAVRLRLRDTALAQFSDETLESGAGLNPAHLPDDKRLAWVAFSILAGLQEMLIAELEGD